MRIVSFIFFLHICSIISLYAQKIKDVDYKLDEDRINIMYVMDTVPEIHRPGWLYNLDIRVEGKILGNLKPTAVTGDVSQLSPNGFQKMIVWEVGTAKENLTDELKVKVSVVDMGGPRYAWKSVLVPGTGLKYVTGRNQIGLLRTASVYLLLAGGITTRLISRIAYDNYLKTENDIFYENTYPMANLMHQVSIVSMSAGLGIWIWDIVNTAHRGRLNKKYLSRPVKVNPISSLKGQYGVQLNWNFGS